MQTPNTASQLLPARTVSDAYRPPIHGAPLDLRLDGNEGPLPSAEVFETLAALSRETIRQYPDARAVEATLAAQFSCAPEQVLVTAGADDALERAIRVMLGPGREAIITEPTFEMIPRYGDRTGGTLVRIPWMQGSFPTEDVVASVNACTSIIMMVSPNNPTGCVATSQDLKVISQAAPHALVVLDGAYAEFADHDLTRDALALPNVVMIRTFSKAWGMAGLRVGFAIGPRDVISWMRASGQPYAVSSLSLALVQQQLQSRSQHVSSFVSEVRSERRELTAFLRDRALDVIDSQANFILARFPDALWMRDALAGQGIAVRLFPQDPVLSGWIRIALPGDGHALERLMLAIDVARDPEAILFDIDDTLADVTCSYRTATIATAESFGKRITFEDITEAKARGSANNDWELTWRLICDRGGTVEYEDVRERFERYYQGDALTPGLRLQESLMLPRNDLEALSRRYRLGVVTGRPRTDAMTFLEEQGIAHLFHTVVTMDDAPLKPDPAPVKLALERLKVRRAWMIGDTPDDMRAARGAGVLPLGVVAPADNPTIAARALIEAGAARALPHITTMMEVVS